MTRPIGATMATAQFEGVDLFIGSETVWGLGVQFEPDGTWGMGGLGGNAAWADPGRGHAIAYVTRRLGDFAAVDRIESALAAAALTLSRVLPAIRTNATGRQDPLSRPA